VRTCEVGAVVVVLVERWHLRCGILCSTPPTLHPQDPTNINIRHHHLVHFPPGAECVASAAAYCTAPDQRSGILTCAATGACRRGPLPRLPLVLFPRVRAARDRQRDRDR
jgi:hypothetical protein